MHTLKQLLSDALHHPVSSALGAGLSAALSGFFNVPVVYVILVLVFFDFLTGIYKAKLTRKTRSSKFSVAGERIVLYILMFIPLHAFSLLNDLMGVVDDFVLGIFLTRELLSILENIKAISLVKQRPFPMLDAIIEYVGLDLPALLEENLPGYGLHEKHEATHTARRARDTQPLHRSVGKSHRSH